MKISKLIIKGFRSFDQNGAEIDIKNKLSAFIGANSAGKTSALEALQKIFGNSIRERELIFNDFHSAKDEEIENIKEKKLSIEVRFEFDDKDTAEIATYFDGMVVGSCGGKPYLRLRLEAEWNASDIVPDGEISVQIYVITVPDNEEESDANKKKFPNHLRSLIQVIYVPAIRLPSEQLKYASGSILYRVLKKITWTKEFKKNFQENINTVNQEFSKLDEFNIIKEELNKSWKDFHKDERYKDISLGFDSTDLDSILKKLELSFSPTETGNPFKIAELGDGYRSLFYLNLVRSLLEIEAKLITKGEINPQHPLLTILAIEEPENHISPQLLGRVISVLNKISEQESAQVFLSSHTSAIVKRIEPESIFHFRITKEYTTEINIIFLPDVQDEAYQYIKQAVQNYPELYFSRLVVIGEGDSEEIIFNRLMKVMDTDFDDNFITFAPLGHRFVNHIWKLLEALHIPYITLLDLDIGRSGGGWGRVKYITEQLIDNGVPKEDILKLSDGSIYSGDKFKNMHKLIVSDENNKRCLQSWVAFRQTYNVYYSQPLDLDFLMLQNYPEFYKKAIPKNGGPQIPDKINDSDNFTKKVTTAVQATLKSESATGATYTEEEKELMIWYNYHFLGRGKPTTHIHALSMMKDEEILANLPEVFKDIFDKIQMLLKD